MAREPYVLKRPVVVETVPKRSQPGHAAMLLEGPPQAMRAFPIGHGTTEREAVADLLRRLRALGYSGVARIKR